MKRVFLIIFTTALFLRVFYVVFILNDSINPFLYDDVDDYNRLANSILDGRGLILSDGKPTAFRAPLYPCMMAGIYAVCGRNNFLAVQLVQSLLGALAAVLCAGIAYNITGKKSTTLIAGLLFAINPMLLYYCGDLGTIALFNVLVMMLFSLLTAAQPNYFYFVAGIILGLANLTRPTIAVLLPLLLLFPVESVFAGGIALRNRIRNSVLFCSIQKVST